MKIVCIIMLALVFSSVLAVFHLPFGSCVSSEVYVSPVDNVFCTDTTVVNSKFNITVWVKSVSNLAGWQVRMTYDPSILKCTRGWQPTWDGQYVFYGRSGFPMSSFNSGYLLLGDVLIPFNQSKFAGAGKLCVIEFNIIAAPLGGRELSCTLDITNNTRLLDAQGDDVPVVKANGYYRYINKGEPLWNFQTFFASNPHVRTINPSNSSDKRLGCAAALVSDWAASAFISARLQNATEGLDTDMNFVNQTQGRPYGDNGTGIISFGGPLVNLIVMYAESGATPQEDRAPIKFRSSELALSFWFANGTGIPGAELNVLSINQDKDMFVIESYRDGDGRFIMLCYGFGWKGTYAAAEYFDAVVYPNLQAHVESWIVVKWEDTNGDGSVNSPTDGDSYSVVAQGG